eukprot:UN20044
MPLTIDSFVRWRILLTMQNWEMVRWCVKQGSSLRHKNSFIRATRLDQAKDLNISSIKAKMNITSVTTHLWQNEILQSGGSSLIYAANKKEWDQVIWLLDQYPNEPLMQANILDHGLSKETVFLLAAKAGRWDVLDD